MKRVIIVCALPLALIGCGKSGGYAPKTVEKVPDASVKPGEEATLLPLKEGNQWVYSVESAQGKTELTLKVVGVRSEGGATIATIQGTATGQQPSTSEWKVDSTGIYQMSDGQDRVFDPPNLLTAFPLEKNKEITSNTTGPLPAGGGTGVIKTVMKYVGPQHVDTDMGRRLGALAVESVSTWPIGDQQGVSRAMTWWAPGVGFVRQRQEIAVPEGRGVILMKLKSYSFK